MDFVDTFPVLTARFKAERPGFCLEENLIQAM